MLQIELVEDVDMSQGKERLFLRQWIGENVSVVTREQWKYSGQLTNIVFDGTRLMYITLDDKQCLNFDHIVEISLQGE